MTRLREQTNNYIPVKKRWILFENTLLPARELYVSKNMKD